MPKISIKTAAPVIIAILTLLVYLQSLQNGFVNWDDPAYVYNNQQIRSLDFAFLKIAFFTGFVGNWHPMTMISYALDYAIWGQNPSGYHLTNVILHSLNTFLVFILARRLISVSRKEDHHTMSFSLIASSLTALLFGIHPLHAESVAWISERKDVLYAFFYLLSILAYIGYVSSDDRKKIPSYATCLIFFILSLLSKPMAVSLPVVLLILDYYPFRRLSLGEGTGSMRWPLLDKIPFFLVAILISVITIAFQQAAGAIKTAEDFTIIGRSIMALKGYIFYLVKMALPFNLAPFYPYPDTLDFLTFESIGPLILFITISFMLVRSSKTPSLFLAIWIYYIASLFPVIGIIKIGEQAAADRYAYLPSVGPFLLSGLAAGYIFERASRKICLIMIGIVLILLEAATIRQIAIWHDPITLWSRGIKLQPQAYKPYILRGDAYYSAGNYKAAIIDYTKAIKINPQKEEAYINRENSYTELGNYEAAISDLNIIINKNLKFAPGFYNRGAIHYILGNYQQAITDYSRAIELNPKFTAAYNNRGIAYYDLGKYKEALHDIEKVIELDPGDVTAYSSRETILKMMDNPH